METALALMQKFIARQKNRPLKIQSVVASEGAGCIYVEAFKISQAKRAIDGMRLVVEKLVPVKEISALLRKQALAVSHLVYFKFNGLKLKLWF